MDGCNSECETFDENHGVCYICDRQLPLNPAGYMKHIGIDHKVVIEYLEKDPKVKHIPPTIYEETAKQLLEPTKLSCGTDKGSLEKNPFDWQIAIAKELTETPVPFNIPGCQKKVSLKIYVNTFWQTHCNTQPGKIKNEAL